MYLGILKFIDTNFCSILFLLTYHERVRLHLSGEIKP
jgi:hypothetical protein